jgi:hypothetical protein
MSAVLEHRVDRLEDALEACTRSVGVEFNKAYNGEIPLQQEMLVGRRGSACWPVFTRTRASSPMPHHKACF